MIPIFAAALEVQDFCRSQGWSFCFIGGLAVQRWGEPRLTQDVDLTILTGFGREAEFIDALLGKLTARRPDARDFALRNRVVLLQSSARIPIDVSLGALAFEERLVKRASCHMFSPGVELETCSAEDLVVLKAFAGRDRDWADIEGVVLRQAGRLGVKLIWRELVPLLELKEDAAGKDRLEVILARGR
ncbi:MAG: nucleotidyl transferase AbiEii/AbiGii toxin family protein, partial [Thermoanaerobaculia bacterium]